jgi:hypothetical protein
MSSPSSLNMGEATILAGIVSWGKSSCRGEARPADTLLREANARLAPCFAPIGRLPWMCRFSRRPRHPRSFFRVITSQRGPCFRTASHQIEFDGAFPLLLAASCFPCQVPYWRFSTAGPAHEKRRDAALPARQDQRCLCRRDVPLAQEPRSGRWRKSCRRPIELLREACSSLVGIPTWRSFGDDRPPRLERQAMGFLAPSGCCSPGSSAGFPRNASRPRHAEPAGSLARPPVDCRRGPP